MVNFKFLIIILAGVLAADCALVRRETFEATKGRCQQENGLSHAEVKESVLALRNETYLEDERKRCYIVCVEEGGGFFKDGKLDVDHVVNDIFDMFARNDGKFNEDKFRTDVNQCAMKEGEGKCAAAYNASICLSHIMMNLSDYNVKE
ncbi:uncharacterized protein [Periplaneta americana]|uniref:uncharacterized protein n=1 Tax=Periplaneta americana TaxID=6978 RepID=UPI0037E92BED